MFNIKRTAVFEITISPLFTAVISVCAFLAIPTPFGIPFTLQTLAVSLCGMVLGVKLGLASTLTYILIGVAGLPVFSGFNGGLGVIFSSTGGFIYGFLALCFFSGLGNKSKSFFMKLLLSFIGVLLCHISGVVHYGVIYKVGLLPSFLAVSLPFIVKDIISIILAASISTYITRLINKALRVG